MSKIHAYLKSPLSLLPTGLAAITSLSVAAPAAAQQLPTPLALASQLDLECHAAAGPPPAQQLFIRQLNPVLQGRLPNQQVVLGPLEDVCVPVEKNGQTPGVNALPIAQWVDLACYEAAAPPVNVDVNLSHLNPVLAALPDEDVTLRQLEQVCVPVRKNNSVIPQVVRNIAKHFDFACYSFEELNASVDFPLVLSHLNPVIQDMNLADRDVVMRRARQLCVPIAKNNEDVPDIAEQYIEWIDFLRYNLTPRTLDSVPAVQAPIPLQIQHMNPLFNDVPPFATVLQAPLKLLVPVAKDGVLPPNFLQVGGGAGGAN